MSARAMAEVLLETRNLSKHFLIGKGFFSRHNNVVRAVDSVALTVRKGETLGVVGETGSGKSTLARLILGLIPPTGGQVIFEGQDICSMSRQQLRQVRQEMQIVFQDPYASLNPRMKVETIISTPLKAFGLHDHVRERVYGLLEKVGLSPRQAERYPHQFSGGQRQRIAIARALALNPKLVVLDEPVSALDVSIRAQILNLLEDLQEAFHLTYVFIAHDLSVVEHISDRVAVMYLGQVVELAKSDELYACPLHPYTKMLWASVPRLSPKNRRKRADVRGEIPGQINVPSGCRFRTRCGLARTDCGEGEPRFVEVRPGHFVLCHHV